MIESYLGKINDSLTAILEDANKRYRLGYISDSLFQCSKEFVLRKGKRIRPLLFVLSYKGYAAKKRATDKRLFASAAALELLHDFMLVHDDVIDNSDLRRGRPTLHKVFDKKIRLPGDDKIGPSLAIVAGDIIFALGIEAFLTVDEDRQRKENALKKLVETAAFTGAGEFIDVFFGTRAIEDLSEKKIFLNYTLKTAKYTFECPLVMGGILAGADNQELRKLSELGLAAGQAFQIYDDFLDLFASEKIIGKPALTDLAESKKTLLVFIAYRNHRNKERKQLKDILEKKKKTNEDLKNFRRLITDSGSCDYCLSKMVSLQKKAISLTQRLRMEQAHKKAIISIISKLSPSSMPMEWIKQK